MNKQELVQSQKKFSVQIQSDTYKNLINNTLGDKDKAQRFIASISSAVAVNPTLQECEAGTILSAALLGESLNLSPSPQLGFYYLVPFNDTKKGYKVAQFQLGYKGYIQLAIRSGYYKKLNVMAIKKGELVRFDELNEEIEVNLIQDEEERENAETIGYYAMFEYISGFRKAIYWSKAKMEKHALRYSQGYKGDKAKHTAYTFWSKDFDGMAYKTMLRQLISKWGIMSTDMQEAYQKDQAVIETNGDYEYVDNETIEDVIKDIPQANIIEEEPNLDELFPKKETNQVDINNL